jgi:hypothetical protein
VKRGRQKRYLTYHHLLELEPERMWISRVMFVGKKLAPSIEKLKKRLRAQEADADGRS